MTYDEIALVWDRDADEYNQWSNISEPEKVELGFATARVEASNG